MRVEAFILHLRRATARRDNALALLDNCGLAGEIWPAVDGAAMSSTDLEGGIGAYLFEPDYPFTLKAGEVGCFLSHRQIWAEMQVREADAALIIEDDATLDPALFATALTLATEHIDRLGYIQFQTRHHKGRSTLVDKAGEAALVVPELGGLRTTAQMVSKRAAAHLLALSEVMDRPVDTFVQSHWHTGLRPAALFPSGVQDIADQLDGSTIQGGRKSFISKIGREIARGRYRSAVARLSRRSTAPEAGGFAGQGPT